MESAESIAGSYPGLTVKAVCADYTRPFTLPEFDANHLRRWFRRHTPDARAGTRGMVVLLDDCFTTYNNPSVGRAAHTLARGRHVFHANLEAHGGLAIGQPGTDQHRGGPFHHRDHARGREHGEPERAPHVGEQPFVDFELVRRLDPLFERRPHTRASVADT